MSISLIIGIIGGLFGLMGVITVAVIIVRSNIATTTATLWQGEASALKTKNDRLEEDIQKCLKDQEDLKNQYKILEGLKSGTVEMTNLTREVIKNGARNLEAINNLNDRVSALTKIVTKKEGTPNG